MRSCPIPSAALSLGLLLAALTPSPAAAGRAAASPPKLVVWVVVDQGRGDMLQRLGATLSEDGLGRFPEEGVYFDDAHFRHLATWTAAGHATLSTGAYADRHGIFANHWYVAGEAMSSVGDPEGEAGPGAYHLRAPTLGDALHLASPESRVVSVSLKDRAAIFMGGEGADGVYWLNTKDGRFVAQDGASAPWVDAFNAQSRADSAFGQSWERRLPPALLAAEAPLDDCPGESGEYGLGRTFPHPMTGGLEAPGSAYYKALLRAPAGTELLLDFALAAAEGAGLGQDDHPDVLFVSISTTDYVGHSFGAQSQEWLELVAHLDGALGGFFSALESQVGKGNLGLVLSADHGAPPVPECVPESVPHGRIWHKDVISKATEALDARFGAGVVTVAGFSDPGLWLKIPPEVSSGDASAVAREALLTLPGVMDVCDTAHPAGAFVEACRLSIVPGRAPHLMVVAEPYYVFSQERFGASGTTHGGPHHYDTHVVMGLWGPGLDPGVRHERTDISQLAATVAAWLRIPPPAATQGPALSVFKAPGRCGRR